eukprot:scaffold398_cov177-Ochromonas_danica.AAC.39
MASFMSYLSFVGELLEMFKVGSSVMASPGIDIDDLVVTLSTSCPKLTSLEMSSTSICSAENVRHLFEQCPHLQDVFISEAIQTENNSVTIVVQGSTDDWAVCLSHVLRRRQYKQVTLRHNSDYYIPVEILKPLLEPYQIHLTASASEACLISLLRDLPHLNSLQLISNGHQYFGSHHRACEESDKVACNIEIPYLLSISDTMLTELIKSCELIEKLTVQYEVLDWKVWWQYRSILA